MKIKDPALFGKINSFFTEYLPVVRRESPNTIKAYLYTINIYFDFLEDMRRIKLWEVSLADFTQRNLLDFMDWLQANRENAVSTVNLRLVHMRKFCCFLMEDNILQLAELAAIQRIAELPTDKAEEIHYLSVEETKLLLAQPKTNTRLGVWDSFFMHLLYDSGCRVQEILDLTKASFVLGKDGAELHVIGKGKKFRAVPLSAELIPMFKEYCSLFHSDTTPDDHLFYTQRKGRREEMSRDNVQRFVEKYGAQARNSMPSIPHIHPHLFRHTRAMHLYMAGMPLETVSQWLGHSQLETSLIYARATTEMKRAAVAKISSKEDSVFKDDEKFKYSDDATIIKRLYGLM